MTDDDAWEDAVSEELDVDFVLAHVRGGKKVSFGDLVLFAGAEPGREYPPSGHFSQAVVALAKLGFESVDDYLGTPNDTEEGDDVILWMYPLIDGEIDDDHPGPYTGLRLGYSPARHPLDRVEDFFHAISVCAKAFGTPPIYRLRETDLTVPANLERLKKDIAAIAAYWRAKGIEPGSAEALLATSGL